MKKFTLFLFTLIIGLAVFCGLNVKATGIALTMTDGASVRTTGEYQGLRFLASVDTLEGSTEHGFFLALGEHSLSDMTTKINAGETTIGGNKLVKKVATGSDLTFAVTVYDIPNTYYVTGITAVAYVKVGSSYTLDKAVTKNIAEVSLNALNAGETGTLLTTVATYIGSNYKKAYTNYAGNFVVNNAAYCYDPVKLGRLFVKDWNNFVDAADSISSITSKSKCEDLSLNYKDKTGADFYYSAKYSKWQDIGGGQEGSVTDISTSNLYLFFNDTNMSAKWGWLLDLLQNADNTVNATRQIVAVKGDGTNSPEQLYSGQHLIIGIIGFFTTSKVTYYYNGIDFSASEASRRSYIEGMLTGAYANTTIYNDDFGNNGETLIGESITLPEAGTPDLGYSWDGFYMNSVKYNAESSYTLTSTDVTFMPKFNPVVYTITYFDGENEINSFEASKYSYTVEAAKDLPSTYTKEGYTFIGWHTLGDFSDAPVESISAGSTGNKVFYAEMSSATIYDVHLTFTMNGGYWFDYNESSYDNLRTNFKNDAIQNPEGQSWASVYGNNCASYAFGSVGTTIFGQKIYKWDGLLAYFAEVNTNANMQWFFNYYLTNHSIPSAATSAAAGYTQTCDTNYLSYEGYQWYSKSATVKTNTGGGRNIITAGNVYNSTTLNDITTKLRAQQTVNFTINGAKVLPTPYKAGATFMGWYDNASFVGEAITVYPANTTSESNVTLYAKWN